MATFLFWNMGKKALQEPLFRLVKRHQVDVLMLAECALSPGAVLEVLNRERVEYHFPQTAAPSRGKIRVFTRFDGEFLEHVENHSGSRWTIRQLFLPGAESVLVVAVHLTDKRSNSNNASQTSECRDLGEHIRRVEERVGHQRTLVIGDFNVNPFEDGMLEIKGLNCEPTRQKVRVGGRGVAGNNFPFFYNPMWNFFGDATRGPAGTYHYSNSQRVRMAWNMFDQVLLRPELLPFFRTEELEILTGDGQDSFLTTQTGVPGAKGGSDHLPIVFKLNL